MVNASLAALAALLALFVFIRSVLLSSLRLCDDCHEIRHLGLLPPLLLYFHVFEELLVFGTFLDPLFLFP